MRTALFTDLHANLEALEACLAHAHRLGVEQYAVLGDLVGYGADPAAVVDWVLSSVQRGAVAVRGNHDAAVVQGPPPTLRPDAAAAIRWTRERLTHEQLGFLADLPLTEERDGRLFVHASPVAPARWIYVLGSLDAGAALRATPARVVVCGHTHVPALYHLGGDGLVSEFEPVPGMPIRLSPLRRWLVVPGSLGQPRDGNPAACWALLDGATDTLTFQRTPYDAQGAARKIRAAGLPLDLGARLEAGS